jgi:hypothetical protein
MPVESVEKITIEGQKRPLYKFVNFQPLFEKDIIPTVSRRMSASPPENSGDYSLLSDIAYSKNIIIDQNTIIHDGPVYIFDITQFSYFHLLYDKILQYEFIKEYVPDIKIVVVGYSFGVKPSVEELYDNIFNMYGIDYKKDMIILNNSHNVLFKEAYNFIFEHNEVLKPFKENVGVWDAFESWIAPKEYENFISVAKNNMLKTLGSLLSTDQNKKIFVSRRIENEKRRATNIFSDCSYYYGTRFISLKDELMLEDFFKSKGYEIVFAENMNFIDQIILYSKASHIAGLKSSGFCNMIFSKPGTKIISINLDSDFRCWYAELANYFQIQYKEVPDLKGEPETLYQQTIFPESVLYFEPTDTIELIKSRYSSLID